MRPPTRVTAARGVHVRGTPLWIDAARKRELCVVTCIGDRLPPAHVRLVATIEMARLLGAAGHRGKVLPTPRERWVGVGGERLQLVDAGVGGLAVGVLVTLAEENVLVTGPLRAAAVDWPRADHIVAHVAALRHRGDSLAGIAETVAKTAAKDRCSVRVESLEVAHALALALHPLGVLCKGRGLVRFLGKPLAAAGRVSLGLARGKHAALPRQLDVDTGLRRLPGGGKRLALRWYADKKTLEQLMETTGVRRLTLIGERDRGLSLPGDVTWRSEPQQLVLGPVPEG